MSLIKKIQTRKEKRKLRVRSRLQTGDKPRVSVFKSLNHIYAQLINDVKQATLASCSTLELEKLKGDKKVKAHAVGLELAKKAKKLGIEEVVFDRGHFLYHGRIKSLADGLREGGLKV
ncbi:MAG: 50S ribosomal protein L18 [Candidatus Babeliales bacterium]